MSSAIIIITINSSLCVAAYWNTRHSLCRLHQPTNSRYDTHTAVEGVKLSAGIVIMCFQLHVEHDN